MPDTILMGPFSLHREKDADIIAMFDGVRNKSQLFRQKMRAPSGDGDLSEIKDLLHEIRAMLQAGITVSEPAPDANQDEKLLELCDSALSKLGC